MFKGDNLFHNYVAISPYNQYSDYFIFDMESQYYENSGGELNVHLYLSVSGSEAWRITDAYEKMLERLHERNYQNFVIKSRQFDQEDHYTIVRPSIEDGLAWLFEN
jgi:predicted alpha/beta superfamily hydrolase